MPSSGRRAAWTDAYYAPVTSPVPALVLSGELDPVTPPTWGLEVVQAPAATGATW